LDRELFRTIASRISEFCFYEELEIAQGAKTFWTQHCHLCIDWFELGVKGLSANHASSEHFDYLLEDFDSQGHVTCFNCVPYSNGDIYVI